MPFYQPVGRFCLSECTCWVISWPPCLSKTITPVAFLNVGNSSKVLERSINNTHMTNLHENICYITYIKITLKHKKIHKAQLHHIVHVAKHCPSIFRISLKYHSTGQLPCVFCSLTLEASSTLEWYLPRTYQTPERQRGSLYFRKTNPWIHGKCTWDDFPSFHLAEAGGTIGLQNSACLSAYSL